MAMLYNYSYIVIDIYLPALLVKKHNQNKFTPLHWIEFMIVIFLAWSSNFKQ